MIDMYLLGQQFLYYLALNEIEASERCPLVIL